MKVNCRHCGAEIAIEIPSWATTPEAQLGECERQAEENHKCPSTEPDKI